VVELVVEFVPDFVEVVVKILDDGFLVACVVEKFADEVLVAAAVIVADVVKAVVDVLVLVI
jgi:hypothetical protein